MNKKKIIIITLIFLILFYFVFNINNLFITEETSTLDYIVVEVKGSVKVPGVYEVKKGSRVSDLIHEAGGLLDNADTSIINLSKELEDEMVVVIYNDEEINEMKKGSTSVKYIERQCVCPILENDACIEEVISNNSIDNKTGLVSLNTGTIEELMTLPGIGESKAKLIIKYRDENGGFKKIEDIMNVKGIGESMFEKIKSYIML